VVRERDTTITGPRGRTIERQVRSERGPGYVDRQINIQRPAGTFQRNVQIQRSPGWVGGGYGGGGYVSGPPQRTFIERDVIIQRPPIWGPAWGPAVAFGTPFAFGIGAPFFNFSFGGNPAPPPVVVAAQPVIAGAPAAAAPQPGAPAPTAVMPPPQAPVPDGFVDAMGRLRSFHEHSRRDGALTLGRMHDPRAVPALIDRLKNDSGREVRIAAAWALGEIGDPRAGVALERAKLFDWRKEVRDAAAEAYARLPREGEPMLGQNTAAAGAPSDMAPRSVLRSDAAPPPPPAPPEPTPPPPPQPDTKPKSSSPTATQPSH
jgi:hypothetical protein